MDPSLPGFGIKVHATGRKTWIYRYRTPDGKLRRISLGSDADGFGVPLPEARQLYHEQKRIRDRDGDPLAARQLKRSQAKEAKSLQDGIWTVRQLLDNHIAQSRDGVDRKRTWLNDKELFDRDVPQEWLDRPAESINRMEAKGLHDQVAARAPRSAALLVAALRKAYNRAVDDGVLESNPFSRLRTTSSKSRNRYLSQPS